MASLNHSTLSKKRKADFFTGFVILFIAIAMLGESLTFPMTDSYGGVDNVWYVSPALFPILVSSLLIILSLTLITKAIRDGGYQQALHDLPQMLQAFQSDTFRRFLMISLYLIAYVYGLVPYGDFFLSSTLFLLAFILPFYLDRNDLFSISFWPLILSSLLIGLLGSHAILPSLFIDALIIITTFFIATLSFFRLRAEEYTAKKWRISVLSAVLTPLILVPCFKFGLLVPLPTEGLIIKTMEDIAYFIAQ